MRWKRFAYAGLLPPLMAGCHGTCFTARDLVTEHCTVHNEQALTRELRKDARCAWREVREQFPRRMFSEEFREGFIDGYTDYLDRGGDGSPPLTPPAKLTGHKKYYTPDGQALLKDYLLGFKYGTDVAVATGCRQFMTVPVLMPEKVPCCTPAVGTPLPPVVVTPAVLIPTPEPLPTPKPLSTSKAVPKPDAGPSVVGGKFPTIRPAVEDRPLPDNFPEPKPLSEPDVTVPNAPLPIPLPPRSALPTYDMRPIAGTQSKFVPTAAPAVYRLPEPPVEVPVLPEDVPTPSVLDDLPVFPRSPK
jgi:hypothetical protein